MSSAEFTIQRDVEMPMRDGTILRGDVYLPQGAGPFPALVERTPYNKEVSPEMQVKSPPFFASQGYAVVVQDVRGKFKSAGKFIPFHDDGWGVNRDGYDTIEWIAAQAWCDGNVGMIGGSYAGATQYRTAPTRPPHLRALYVRESSADYYREWVFHDGAFELGFMHAWTLNMELNNLAHLVSADDYPKHKGRLDHALKNLSDWQGLLPLNPNPLLEGINEWYDDFMAHPAQGPYWQRWSIELQHHEVDVPIVHLGGWFDIFLNGTIKNFVGLKAKARSQKAREGQRLLIGPWIHGPWNMATSKQGEVDFGADAIRDYNAIRVPWFDYWLKGKQTGVLDEPPVQLFVMGENRWRDFGDYPVPKTRYTNWYLHDDGILNMARPHSAERADSYVYDPMDPVPTIGGNLLIANVPGGVFDQRPIEHRCLIYTSEPLTQDLTIIGDVKFILHAMSSAPDTDWIVRLTDVHPDGYSRLLCDGILRARYRESFERQTLLTPHQVYEFVVDLWATANTFKAGHRIRVAITSSSFPRFDRNLNTGGEFGKEVVGQVALNTVFHDVMRPSHIVLPVVD